MGKNGQGAAAEAITSAEAFSSYVGSRKARYALMPNPLLHRAMPTRTV